MKGLIPVFALVLLASGCAATSARLEDNKRTVLDFYDWFVKQNYPDVKEAQSKDRATALAVNE